MDNESIIKEKERESTYRLRKLGKSSMLVSLSFSLWKQSQVKKNTKTYTESLKEKSDANKYRNKRNKINTEIKDCLENWPFRKMAWRCEQNL